MDRERSHRWHRVRGARAVRLAAVYLVAFSLVLALGAWRDARAGDKFDFVRWERSSLANKWLYALGAPLRDDPGADEAIAGYYARDGLSDAERRRIENTVEATIEGRIDAVLDDLGVSARISLPGSVFPPVDIELAGSPRVLVVSPRARIERVVDRSLRPDVTRDEAIEIEREVEAGDPDVAALIVTSGGVATYPAIVSAGSYASAVDGAAHEWVHHYLSFYTLGFNYFSSNDLKTINETVASIAGDEIAAVVIDRYGDPAAPAPNGDARLAPDGPSIDAPAVLRELRLDVDALLADGRIEEAEALMERVRLELDAGGVSIRRINQAYFAWFGTYAARPDAVDPLGPQLFEIRELSGSLGDFLEAVRGADSRADIERVLDELRGG
jgi:hypothetical protein